MKVFSDGSAMWREWENDRVVKRVYVGECAGSYSVGWMLKKKRLDDRQARRVVYDRSKWQGFVKGNAWGLTGPDFDEMPQLWVVMAI